jgi:hypothetical protein
MKFRFGFAGFAGSLNLNEVLRIANPPKADTVLRVLRIRVRDYKSRTALRSVADCKSSKGGHRPANPGSRLQITNSPERSVADCKSCLSGFAIANHEQPYEVLRIANPPKADTVLRI